MIKTCLQVSLSTLIMLLVAFATYCAYATWRNPPRTTGVNFHKMIQSDAKLGYVTKPNLHYTTQNQADFPVFTDSYGTRVSNSSGYKIEDIDVLAVGCSQVYGFGIDADNTFANQLASMTGLKVLNLGVSGYGSVAALRRTEQFLDRKPKFVVLGFYYDHLIRNVNRCFPGYMLSCLHVPYIHYDAHTKISEFREPADNSKILRLTGKYYAYMDSGPENYTFMQDYYWKTRSLIADFFNRSKYFFGRRQPNEQEGRATTEFLLRHYKEKFGEHGTKLIILYIPDYFDTKVKPAPSYLKQTVTDLGLDYLDLTLILQAAIDNNIEIILPHDGHLNAFAHKKIAEALAAHLNHAT